MVGRLVNHALARCLCLSYPYLVGNLFVVAAWQLLRLSDVQATRRAKLTKQLIGRSSNEHGCIIAQTHDVAVSFCLLAARRSLPRPSERILLSTKQVVVAELAQADLLLCLGDNDRKQVRRDDSSMWWDSSQLGKRKTLLDDRGRATTPESRGALSYIQ
jgi:hypothetical protein